MNDSSDVTPRTELVDELEVLPPSTAKTSSVYGRPDFAFMRGHAAHWLALGFGSGLLRFAPGTMGTLFAWWSFGILQGFFSTATQGWIILLCFFVGLWACQKTSERLGVMDSSHVVWDEIVAFWLILWLLAPASFSMQCAAFLLFRFFDAVKWGPTAWADQRFKGFGWRGALGIMLDDLIAAFMTLFVIAAWISW